MAVGKDHIGNNDGVQHILKISRERFAPDANDYIYPDVSTSMNFERTDRTMDTSLMEFDMLREKAE